jgi:hypothetical protein
VLADSPSTTWVAPPSTVRALGRPNSSSTSAACTATAPKASFHGKADRFSERAQQTPMVAATPNRLCAF